MQPTVRIAFDLTLAGAGNFLTLSDPIRGQLDDSSYPLAGEVLTDVTSDVRSVSVRRGRSNETTNVDTGTATVVLDNRQRLYDPTASASVSPYAPSILPRKEIDISIGDDLLFRGLVEDWDLQYESGGDSVTLAKCADGFTLLTQQTITASAGFTGLSGSVIYDTASAASWPVSRLDLDEGTASVAAHTIDPNTKVLPYLQKISNTEQALLFVSREGVLSFRDRIAPRRTMNTVFADNGTGIPFSDIEIIFGTEFLYTQITVDFPGGSASATSGSFSVANYGLTELSLDTFLPSDGTEAGIIAAFLAERYGEPTFRIVGLQVEMDSLTPTQQERVVNLDLSDGVRVIFTPNGIGEAIERVLAVDSIEHEISPGGHTVRLKFFEPFLSREVGSVLGISTSTGTVIGAKGAFGSAEIGVSGTAGSVIGAKGASGTATGSSGTSGTVVGVAVLLFALDFSELDGPDVLG